jgi:hypothetical protein
MSKVTLRLTHQDANTLITTLSKFSTLQAASGKEEWIHRMIAYVQSRQEKSTSPDFAIRLGEDNAQQLLYIMHHPRSSSFADVSLDSQRKIADSISNQISMDSKSVATPGSGSVRIRGERIDGWADLVDGAGGNAEKVNKYFTQLVNERGHKHLTIEHQPVRQSGSSGKVVGRNYRIIKHPFGVSMAVYVGAIGKDLYVTWNAYIKPVLNPLPLIIIGVMSFFAGLSVAGSIPPWAADSAGVYLGAFLAVFLLSATVLSAVVAWLGKLIHDNLLGLFIRRINEFVADDITAMMFAVHHSLLKALDKAGIEQELLRPKKEFHAGRRDRII